MWRPFSGGAGVGGGRRETGDGSRETGERNLLDVHIEAGEARGGEGKG